MMITLQLMIKITKSRIFLQKSAITQVSAALQAWSGELERRTGEVTSQLDSLSAHINKNINSVNKLHDYDTDVAKWQETVMGQLIPTTYKVDSAIKKLDGTLQNRVQQAYNLVELHIHNVDDGVEREQKHMMAFGNKVKGKLEKIKIAVNKNIVNCFKELSKTVEHSIKNIHKQVKQIDDLLKERVEELQKWIGSADETMQSALGKVTKILEEVDSSEKSVSKEGIEAAAKDIERQADIFHNQFTQLKDQYNDVFTKLKGKKGTGEKGPEGGVLGKLLGLYETVKGRVPGRFDDFNTDSGEWYLNKSSEISNITEHIKTSIKAYVTKQLGGRLKTALKKYTKIIADDDEDDSDDDNHVGVLELIETGLMTHAMKFKYNFNNEILPGWLDDILGRDGKGGINAVKSWMKQYADGHISQDIKENIVKDKVSTHVKTQIIKHLSAQISEAQNRIATENDITTNLIAVTGICKTFAEQLGQKFDKGDISYSSSGLFVRGIVDTIEAELETSTARPSFRSTLQEVVKTTVIALCSKAKQVENELGSLLDEKGINIGKVNEAIAQVISLGGSLEKEIATAPDTLGPLGETINEALGDAATGEEFNNRLTALLHEAVIKGVGAFEKALQGPVIQVISDMKKDINIQTSVAESTKSQIETQARKVTSTLKALCQAIKAQANDQDGLKHVLTEFKTKTIGRDSTGELQQLKERFSQLQSDNVDKLTDAVGKLLIDTFPNAVRKCTQTIRVHFEAKIDDAVYDIKKDVLKRYVTSKKSELQQLRDFVDEKLQEVTKIIEADKQSGLKGFLRTLIGVPADERVITTDNKLDAVKNYDHSLTTHPAKFQSLSEQSLAYLKHIHTYVSSDLPKHLPSSQYPSQLSTIHSHLSTLLSHLSAAKHFTHEVPGMLAELKASVQALHSTGFGNPAYPVLDAFPKSLLPFVEQLERGYVNRYEGGEEILLYNYLSKKITPEGEKCAKIFLTLLETVNYDLRDLLSGHDSHKALQIYLKGENRLGRWFKGRGFKVSDDDKTQNGELDRKKTGGDIRELLVKDDGKHVYRKDTGKTDTGPLRQLVGPLRDYYRVCHYEILPKPRAPSSVKDMLQWLLGLYFNPIYNKLGEYFKELFEKPKHHEDKKYSEIDESQLSLDATSTITPKELKEILRDVCLHSENTLIAILGRGHENGSYAVDFYTNAHKLDYPSSPSVCFDLLVDILFRVYHQLHFVFSQCQNGTSRGGWSDCYYGRGVGGSDWNCNKMQCPDQMCGQTSTQNCNQSATQNHNQTADQKFNQHPICGLKSPLQSFFEDGLPGFLPHSFKSPGCKLECTLANTE
ncbi:hypothetical protein, conserved [Babesia ovata]|uniref:Extracellular matrix-binding ebh n=1 Tax=Babesia ovata TaxID=189622 RepID=A0A2H6KJW0_9APIC|nr:uncharacterized protein BOVATA_047780 [Babesia ovata]GBE63285.1 hypothetical protein, conserved [Babesia ovata]